MMKALFNIPYEKHMNRWTLSFEDARDEDCYSHDIDNSMQIPLLIRILLYLGMAHQCFYRVFAVYAVSVGLPVPTGTLIQEVSLTLYLAIIISIEVMISHISSLKSLRGCFYYICFPTLAVTTAFVTQKAPRFGLP